jgi:hypothetical protein
MTWNQQFHRKHSLQFDQKKPQEFIQKVKKIVDTQLIYSCEKSVVRAGQERGV